MARCEDYPCCGHEAGDCDGRRYDTDDQIKAHVFAMDDEAFDQWMDRGDDE